MRMVAINNMFKTRQFENEDVITFVQRFKLPLELLEVVCGGPLVPFDYLEIRKPEGNESGIVEQADAVVERADTVTDNNEDENTAQAKNMEPYIAAKDSEYKQFVACMFLNSLDKGRHKAWLEYLDSEYLAGRNNYPKTLREAVEQAQHREKKIRRNKARKEYKLAKKTEQGKDRVESSFAQQAGDKSTGDKPKSILKPKRYKISRKPITCRICGGKGHASAQCSNLETDSEQSSEFYQSENDDEESHGSFGEYGGTVGFGGLTVGFGG
jgi:hypothetical protein